jgi:glycosyltransferase involved in cell wall biosynthesis
VEQPLKIMIVATKAPWPPVDGGRVVVLETLRALSGAGHEVVLVAPVAPGADLEGMSRALRDSCRPELVTARPMRARSVMAASLLRRRPVTVVRHQLPEVRQRVADLLAAEPFDVVQAEQLQAVSQAVPASARGIPLIHRAHNVESRLWIYAASFGRPLASRLLRREARQLAAWEGQVLRTVSATVVLTDADLEPLRRAAGSEASIHPVPVPYPGRLEPGSASLDGRPAVVTLASPTWLPSLETVRRIARGWWPEVRRSLPEATLHVFGGVPGEDGDGVFWHGAPEDSAEAFTDGAVMAIPFRHPTGVPVKALEAMARGVPLVVSSETAAALASTDGKAVAVADQAEALARVLGRLVEEEGYRQSLIDGGRELLAARHDPSRIATQLAAIYRELASRRS